MALAVCLSLASMAGHTEDVRKQVVATTLITGTVQVTPEGKVHSYTLDQADKLAPAVRTLLDKNIPVWTFKRSITLPIDITERMTIRLLAAPVDDKHDRVSIIAASFDDDFHTEDARPTSLKRVQPKYPLMALDARVQGTVYTLVLVGRDGKTRKTETEQVNLRSAVPEHDQERMRNDLARAASAALQDWTWNVPTTGKYANAPGWYVRVPVRFNLQVRGAPPVKEPGLGEWEVYIPGPRLKRTSNPLPPELLVPEALAQGSDAIADGHVQAASSSVELTSPLDGG
ncbi:hypothetical protein DVT68_17285 [Dyella solisilvae]|uniref:Energy transducer TonB n=1 Tax=Dyella solisilvae TaxID=1920168 RepID=A0A370K4A1_9GAMM|nr:hypothetical protein [Dyella solisilvae]RDI97493.1 hypothetical protein DVT68_17285 [Dyella solisilvae]